MLYACGHIVLAQVVGIGSLIAQDLFLNHAGVYDGILAETLPYAWPARVAAQVQDGVEYPRTVGGAALICSHLTHLKGKVGVK